MNTTEKRRLAGVSNMLTYITTYYNNPELLTHLKETLDECNNGRLRMIIVDDGSLADPAYRHVKAWNDPRVTLYKVLEDKGFNSHGARNLAMQETTTEWNVLLDIDYQLKGVENLNELVDNGDLEKDVPHFFGVVHPFEGRTSPHRISINDFLVTKELYWKAGGYDSELFNLHVGDRKFISRMLKQRSSLQSSVVPDSYLVALRTPFVKTQVDRNLTDPHQEWYSKDHRTIYVSPLMTKEAEKQEIKIAEREEKNLPNIPITFPWERQL